MRHQRKITPISRKDKIFFEEFLTNYEGFILHMAMKYARPEISLDDIRQEAVLRLICQIPKLRTLNHNKTCSYIANTVQSSFCDLYRHEKKHSHLPMDDFLEEVVGMERDLVPDLFIRQELQRLRKGLHPRQWLALKGKYICGYSQEELGKQLEIAPDSVRTFLSRTRKQCRQILSLEKVAGGDDDD